MVSPGIAAFQVVAAPGHTQPGTEGIFPVHRSYINHRRSHIVEDHDCSYGILVYIAHFILSHCANLDVLVFVLIDQLGEVDLPHNDVFPFGIGDRNLGYGGRVARKS